MYEWTVSPLIHTYLYFQHIPNQQHTVYRCSWGWTCRSETCRAVKHIVKKYSTVTKVVYLVGLHMQYCGNINCYTIQIFPYGAQAHFEMIRLLSGKCLESEIIKVIQYVEFYEHLVQYWLKSFYSLPVLVCSWKILLLSLKKWMMFQVSSGTAVTSSQSYSWPIAHLVWSLVTPLFSILNYLRNLVFGGGGSSSSVGGSRGSNIQQSSSSSSSSSDPASTQSPT